MSYFSHDDAENAPKTCFHVPYHHPVTQEKVWRESIEVGPANGKWGYPWLARWGWFINVYHRTSSLKMDENWKYPMTQETSKWCIVDCFAYQLFMENPIVRNGWWLGYPYDFGETSICVGVFSGTIAWDFWLGSGNCQTFFVIQWIMLWENRSHHQINKKTGWWLGHPSEKYEFVHWDD